MDECQWASKFVFNPIFFHNLDQCFLLLISHVVAASKTSKQTAAAAAQDEHHQHVQQLLFGKDDAVVCNDNHECTHLALTSNNSMGPMPHELALLTKLQMPDMPCNEIHQDWPHAQTFMDKHSPLCERLLHLTMQDQTDHLMQDIPTHFGRITNLKVVVFSNIASHVDSTWTSSTLAPAIPSELGNLFNLLGLHLEGLCSKGTIPFAAAASLTNLVHFSVGRNQLQGTLPDQLGPRLIHFKVSDK